MQEDYCSVLETVGEYLFKAAQCHLQ